MQDLIAAGATINPQDSSGQTPLVFAVSRGYQDVAKLLLENGADPEVRNSEGTTVENIARSRGDMAMVELIRLYLPDVKEPESA